MGCRLTVLAKRLPRFQSWWYFRCYLSDTNPTKLPNIKLDAKKADHGGQRLSTNDYLHPAHPSRKSGPLTCYMNRGAILTTL
jgi:hypothetical protein